jgi:hypothetical protein
MTIFSRFSTVVKFAAMSFALATFSLASLAQASSKQTFNWSGYTCNFLPTEQMYLGRVYQEKDFYQFPKGMESKAFLTTEAFKVDLTGIEPYQSSGERYTKLENVTLEAAIDILGLELTPSELAKLKADGSINRNVALTRQIDQHRVWELSSQRVKEVKNWFKEYRKDPEVKDEIKKKWKFYVVREIRVAQKLTYRVKKDVLSGAGISLESQSFKPGMKLSNSTQSDYEILGDFDRELTFCAKVERLDKKK